MQDTLMDIVREEFKSLTTLDNNMHLKFTDIDEPLNQEEAIEIENQIIREQGTIYIYHNFLFIIMY